MTEKSADWRNKIVKKTCRNCGECFEGKYNSTSCAPCKVKIKERVKSDFKRNNPDYWSNWQKTESGRRSRKKVRLNSYKLSQDKYELMMKAQSGACKICGKSSGWKANGGNLVIDHCHETGSVRGLLCPPCNRGLGQFEDNAEYLRKAAFYIADEIAKREGAA